MKGVVLAAGKGSRLAELNLRHKSFALVQKKHVINFSLDLLVGWGKNKEPLVDEIIIVVGYHAQDIIDTIGDEYKGVPVTYVYQHELKGIAHAVLTAREAIDDDFVMCLADEILLNPRLGEMIETFCRDKSACICGVIIDGTDFSMKPISYEVKEDGTIIKVREKPDAYPNDIRGIGECVFSKKCLDYLSDLRPNPRRGELEMGDWIQMAVDDQGTAKVFTLADAYVNINYAKDIESANKLLDSK